MPNQMEWTVIAIFFLILPLAAAIFPVLDTIIKEQLPLSAALRSREFWTIWFVYFILALLVALILNASQRLELGVIGFATFCLGFPMALQSKLLSWKDPNTGAETAIGFEYLLKVVNQLLVPGMKDSLNEFMANMQAKWLELDLNKVGGVTKNYLSNRLSKEAREKVLTWIDQLVSDANQNPEERERNLRALFLEVRQAGGPRGVGYVIKHCPRTEKTV